MLRVTQIKKKKIKRVKKHKAGQDGFHPIGLTDNKMIEHKLENIHNNPIEVEIVTIAEDYKYSSAINNSVGNGLLMVELL